MRRVLGILTEDFRLYHDLVATLKARDIPFVSLSSARRIPESVGAILTSASEAPRIRSKSVVAAGCRNPCELRSFGCCRF